MNLRNILQRANVLSNGAVLLGEEIVVDSHSSRKARIVTHTHTDHIIELRKSISFCQKIIGTPLTLELLRELGYNIPINKITSLNYEEKMTFEDGTLQFKKALHIMGAAQVVFDDFVSGLKITYTGDFKKPNSGTPVITDTDVLIIESTYGKPEWVRPFKYEIEIILIDFIKRALREGPVHIFGFHGKIQEVMELLRLNKIDVPIIVPNKIHKITQIGIKHGLNIDTVFKISDEEAKSLINYGWYVYFDYTGGFFSKYNVNLNRNAIHILLTGWEFKKPIKKLSNNRWIIAFSDHADFEELMKYVETAQPKVVITDSVRSSAAAIFAHEVRKRLGIYALPLPQKTLNTLNAYVT